jgi:fermentation-respiration switch protein FrsA (DUF1100 family)
MLVAVLSAHDPMRLAVTITLALVVVWALIWFGQRGLIYFPASDAGSPAAAGLPAAEAVAFDTADGIRLEGWFVPPARAPNGYTVLVFNGNAGNRRHRARLAAQLAARGFATLIFDYRGYGGNPGLPSEAGLARDARAALGHLGGRPDVDIARLIFFGESLGAAVAVEVALDFPPAAVVLRSPVTSLAETAEHHLPFLPARWLLRDRYPTIERIARLRSALVVIAGDADRVVPFEQSEDVYETAPSPKRFVRIAGADHNDEDLAEGPIVIRAVADVAGGTS